MAAGETTTAVTRPGALDLYRALWAERHDIVRRFHLDLVLVAVLIAAWIVIRTWLGEGSRLYLAWVLVIGALTLASPRLGLMLYIATGAFFEPVSIGRVLGRHDLLVLVLGLSVAARVVLDRGRSLPRSASLFLAVLLAFGTLAGLAHTVLRFDPDWASHAAYTWVSTVGGGLILLFAAAWVSRKGDLSALLTAVSVAVVVSVIALAERASPGLVSGGPFAWVGFWKDFGPRLAGIIPSPNGIAAQLVGPAALLLVAAAFARDLRLRVVSVVALVPLVVALYLTYSRSPLVALVAVVVIVAWRIRRLYGVVAFAVVLAASLAIVPSYLAFRGGSLGPDAQPQPGQLLIATDQLRIQAWGAALRMWQDQPLIGQGFLSYKLLAVDFGDPVLGSPHNEWLRFFAEEGTVVGLLAVAFVVFAMRELGRIPGWPGTAFLSAFAAIVLAASFNNPFLFLQVSVISFTIAGAGLALAARAGDPAVQADPHPYTPERRL